MYFMHLETFLGWLLNGDAKKKWGKITLSDEVIRITFD
jgi:hypothetical protein